mgnify:CR=1 FL=1|jgi:hypothetical protein
MIATKAMDRTYLHRSMKTKILNINTNQKSPRNRFRKNKILIIKTKLSCRRKIKIKSHELRTNSNDIVFLIEVVNYLFQDSKRSNKSKISIEIIYF